MFTGIIERTTSIVAAKPEDGCLSVRMKTPRGWKLQRGQSVSVDGICSTVVSAGRDTFQVEYMPETLLKTIACDFAVGRVVNLERSLRFGSRVEGHLVQGHVDCRVRVAAIIEKQNSRGIVVAIPRAFSQYIRLHGSLALNGVSLTVAGKGRGVIRVALIPYTLAHTDLGAVSVGDEINLETDRSTVLARASMRDTVGRHATKRVREKGETAGRLKARGRHRRR